MPDQHDAQFTLESIRAEAVKWRRLADAMAGPRAGLTGLRLGPDAFFFPGAAPAGSHAAVYDELHDRFVGLLGAALTEFAELGDVLDDAAADYAETDERAAAALRSVYDLRPEGS